MYGSPCRSALIALALSILPAQGDLARAQAPEAAPARIPWYESLLINGFVSGGLSYNTNRPDSRTNQMRVFDRDDNSFTLDALEISLQKPASQPGDAGFCVHLMAGSSVPKVARSTGLTMGDLDFHQMYLRYIAPAGRGLTIDAGKFTTPLGYELIPGYDGYNDNATRSFLFGYAIPFTHTGLRMAYPFSEAVTGTILLVNGWDNAIDNNRSKTVGGQLSLAPAAGMTITAGALYGPEQDGRNGDNRTVVDLTGIVTVNPLLTLGVNGDYGTEQRVAPGGGTAMWNGAAVYLRCTLSETMAVIVRGERFEDREGTRTGVAQLLHGITVTPEFRLGDGLVLRSDVRLDLSNREVFERAGGLTDRQFTVCFNVLCVY